MKLNFIYYVGHGLSKSTLFCDIANNLLSFATVIIVSLLFLKYNWLNPTIVGHFFLNVPTEQNCLVTYLRY